MEQRVELACHTGYSRMDGIGLGKDLVIFASENDISTLVVTDTGNVDGYVDLQQNIKWLGLDIKLIMGADLFIIDDRDIDGKVVTSGRLSVLIRNEIGKKNLYKILSEGERKYKSGQSEPQIPLSLLLDNREGLLIGSGSKNGLLVYSHDVRLHSEKTLGGFDKCGFDKDIYKFLDYIEIPAEGISDAVKEELLDIADYYKIPAVGICAPHYMRKEQSIAYSVLRDEIQNDTGCYKNTDDMLELFDFLGKEKAYEIVVTNSNLIADMCEEVPAIPDNKMYPFIENQDEILRNICETALAEKYIEISSELRRRLDWELNAIKVSESAFMFIQIKDVIDRLGVLPFEISSRGFVGSSLVAHLCGISEIDPIKANLSPYFFFGFSGDKELDIDLNFGSHIRSAVESAFAEAPGVGRIVRAGTLATISERYAERILDSYSEKHNIYFWGVKASEIIDSMTKCVKTRGQHPGGLMVLPKGTDITDICPVTGIYAGTHNVEASAFDYHSIDHIAYKFDALEHTSPEILKRLYDITGANPEDIRFEDPEVMDMFTAKNGSIPQCAGIPEFGSEYVLSAIKVANPQNFDELVKLCGLMHGTEVWLGNAEDLIKEGTTGIAEVIADRDDVYNILCSYGIDEETAFNVAEDVRKGKVRNGKSRKWNEWKAMILNRGVPDWFVQSCEKIRYLFPKAHSYAYVLSAWRIAWYKLHYPLEFYAVMLNVSRGTGFDLRYMAGGKEKLNQFMQFLNSDYASDGHLSYEARKTCIFLHDYYERGFEFVVSERAFDDGDEFYILDNHTIEVAMGKQSRTLGDYDEIYIYK